MRQNVEFEEVEACQECGSKSLETDGFRGELVCAECGLVIEQGAVDQGAEWRAFDNDQNKEKARTGRPLTPLIHDRGLSTEIGWQNVDYSGAPLSAASKRAAYRYRKWQKRNRIRGAKERNLAIALTEMDRMASNMGLPANVRESAAVIYRQAVAKQLIRGRSIDGVAAAAMYAACRECGVPRTLDEIATVSRTGRKELGRIFRFIKRTLGLTSAVPQPEDYIARFCSKLGLGPSVQRKAAEIIELARISDIVSGRGPTGVCAASIYIASIECNSRRTQSEIAKVTGVTEVTIRNRYKEMVEKLRLNLAA